MNITRGLYNYTSSGKTPINAEACSQFALTRILLGNIYIKNCNKKFIQDTDYSKLTPIHQSLSNGEAFLNFIKSEGIANNSASFINKTIADNRPFFEDLLWEFSNFFNQSNRGSHTSAFIFLYRIIERLSYSIPALYFSCSNDYYSTFNDLQELLNEKGQGELGLLRKFLSQGRFLDSTEISVVYDINFTSSYGLKDKYFRTVLTKIKPKLKSSDISIHKMQIEFIDIFDFLIKTRNRFFHSRTGDGKANIKASEIEELDEFFSIINKLFISFTSFMVLRSISKQYSR